MSAKNKIGLSKRDYKGAPTTLCQGCGHNSILSQIIAACYEMDIAPEDLVKFSGIGCSSKAPTYMLSFIWIQRPTDVCLLSLPEQCWAIQH